MNSCLLPRPRRHRQTSTAACLLATALWLAAGPATAAPPGPRTAAAATSPTTAGDDTLLQAREALRTRDRSRLVSARNELQAAGHPLALWADYWELTNRLADAQQPELDAFYARWPGSYVEDRLRNDWLLELGRRRDWANFRVEFPRFRLNDDREVTCHAVLTQHLDGQDVRAAAQAAWWAQRDNDEGCQQMAAALVEAKVLKPDDAWQAARLAAENNRPRAARQAAALAVPAGPPALSAALSAAMSQAVADLFKDPARFLAHPATVGLHRELAVLGLIRLAAADPEAAAGQLDSRWQRQLTTSQAATAWAHVARQAAMKQQALAGSYVDKAWKLRAQAARAGHLPLWSDELLAWQARAALRLPAGDSSRWPMVSRAIDSMTRTEQSDPAWQYWKARASNAMAAPGADGDAARSEARLALRALAAQTGFYAKVATEDLGGKPSLPPAPLPLTAAERSIAQAHPGLNRALQLVALGLRNEGVREWNFSLRGMDERELLGAAQRACDKEVWDRCINTSERTRSEIDMAQRYPTPFRDAVRARAAEIGVDPAFMYGLIRQESRFIMETRSNVGAAGLMQLMPDTARWTARKIGLAYTPAMINDRDTNLRLGTTYLKLVLDDFGGSQALAAAAYNAGPSRSRRWREGPPVEAAAWAESIPFSETRDYVKKVLSNAVDYTLVLARATPGSAHAPASASIKGRLGPSIGPAISLPDAPPPPSNSSLP